MRLALTGLILAAVIAAPAAHAAERGRGAFAERIDAEARAIEPRLIAWRRDIHQHPELGGLETRTAALVAAHLRKLGMEVETGVGGTGVVGLLKGGKLGPVVALRADMDGLPVLEETGLPFASKAMSTYEGKAVPVMHACGHDAHVAILMATAEILAGLRAELPGTVKFIFQPAEEGPADFAVDGKRTWGARRMVEEGVMRDPEVDAVFGLHVGAGGRAGEISWRSGPIMAASDTLNIRVNGRQTHGAAPWNGVDPIVVGSQIVLGLQTIASRQVEVTREPTVITVGQFNGGVRQNIIPDRVDMAGTIRTFDAAMQADIHQRIDRTARLIAESAGATAEVEIFKKYPVTANDPALTARMEPTLIRVAGDARRPGGKQTGAEDFSFLHQEAPGLYVFLGVTPPELWGRQAPNHSPRFVVDERALVQGVRLMTNLATDYLGTAETF